MFSRLLCCGGGGGRKATTTSASPLPASSKPAVTAAAAAAAAGDASADRNGENQNGDERVSGKTTTTTSTTSNGDGPAMTTTTLTTTSTSTSTSSSSSSNPPQTTTSFPRQDEIWPLITAATQRALQSGALSPIETDVAPPSSSSSSSTAAATTATATTEGRLSDGGWSFVLRVASNLKSKDADGREQKRKEAAASPERPTSATKEREKSSPSPSKSPPPPPVFNPFLPYDPRLWVAHLPPSHELLLNKFPVSMNHALVVTREFEEQCDALSSKDLGATWAVLDAVPGVGGLAFFNRGPESGASQRHKHLQVVPLPLDATRGASGGGGGGGGGAGEWAPFEGVALAATAAAAAPPLAVVALKGDNDDDSGLPFRAFAARMPPRGGPTPEALAKCVSDLVEACFPGETFETLPPERSFNLLMTRRVAVAVPRRSGTCGGYCSPNAVAFAGSMLARSEEELAFVREKGPMAILAECGVPW